MLLPKIALSQSGEKKVDAVALGWFQEESAAKEKGAQKSKWTAPRFLGRRQKDLDTLLSELKQSQHFQGKKAEVSFLRYYEFEGAPNALLLGLGQKSKWTSELARQAGATLYAAQKKEKLANIRLVGDSVFAELEAPAVAYFVQAFCEGYWMASYEYRETKKEVRDGFAVEGMEILVPKGTKWEPAINKAQILIKAVNFARSLGDKPGNILTPTEFGRLAEKMAKESGLRCQVLGRAALEKEKMGLFIGVAKGSVEEPKLIVLEHRGGKKSDAPIALVGKGITFDSGGISIKPAQNMEDMKYDMMGAAAVSGIMQAVAELKVPVNVVGVIAACENMPDGKAQKPGDVMRSISGKTVEITNTDAEGRLVLADAIEYTQENFHPQAMLDFATLTGAVVVALGSVATGVMGNNPSLLQRMKDSAGVTGERVWELPLYEEYEEDLKSSSADIRNSGSREAGSSKGGTFLKFFVDPKVPWVHCDIAGAAYHRKDVNYHPSKYAAGVMVRLVSHLLENWTPLK